MSIAPITAKGASFRWLASRTLGSNSLLVLTYHRVLPRRDPLLPGEVDVEAFAAQMAFLQRHLAPMPLVEAVGALKHRRLRAGAVTVTFDDGYANNLTEAVPVLRHYGIPATVFVAVGLLNGGLMFNDALLEVVRRTRADHLDASLAGLGSLPLRTDVERRAALAALIDRVKYLAPQARLPLAMDLAQVAGADLPRDLMLTTDQLRALVAAGVEVGGHTVSHPILSALDGAAAQAEIAGSYRTLASMIGQPPRSFAYPNGVPGRDFRPEHVTMVREAGYEVAVTTEKRLARAADDPLQVPRATFWRSDVLGLWRNLAAIRAASRP